LAEQPADTGRTGAALQPAIGCCHVGQAASLRLNSTAAESRPGPQSALISGRRAGSVRSRAGRRLRYQLFRDLARRPLELDQLADLALHLAQLAADLARRIAAMKYMLTWNERPQG
jgi:hypothetical protein